MKKPLDPEWGNAIAMGFVFLAMMTLMLGYALLRALGLE